MVKGKVFIVDKRENIQRHLEESKAERKRSGMDMARAICKSREYSCVEEEGILVILKSIWEEGSLKGLICKTSTCG